MKRHIFIVFDKESDEIRALAATISKAVQENYAPDEIASIIGGGNAVLALPAEYYNGPIHESFALDIETVGDYVTVMFTKEENTND